MWLKNIVVCGAILVPASLSVSVQAKANDWLVDGVAFARDAGDGPGLGGGYGPAYADDGPGAGGGYGHAEQSKH